MLMAPRGFSLLELLIVLVIAGILAAISAPYFRDLYLNNQITGSTNDLVQAAYAARIEAIKRTQQIRISSVDSSTSTDEWGPGLVVYLDVNANTNFDLGTDEEIRVLAAAQGNQTIDEPGGITDFNFLPNGRTDSEVTFRICDGRSGETGRQVTITQRGQVRTSNFSCG